MWRRRPFDIWRDFDKEFEEMEKMIDRMLKSLENMPEGGKPMVYGFSVEIGPDGIPKVQQFGNVKPATSGTLHPGLREPYTSTMVDQEHNQLTITAEMPGVSKENIEVSAKENAVSISAGGDQIEYEKNLRLSKAIDPDSAKATFKNGVLDIIFNLKEPAKEKGKRVNVG